MPASTDDLRHLADALAMAQHAIGLSDPNPRVGCVIVAANQHVPIGRGHTHEAGGPHAEVAAMRQAREGGHALHGATAYVTLEPCSHHGRTPPCAAALAEAGIARVVVLGIDPNPLVAGQGLAMLKAAGVQVDLMDDDGIDTPTQALRHAARELNIGFFSRMVRSSPWVRMKIAASLDGRTALHNGHSQWITGDAARTDGHAWRKRASAVLTGAGTVRDDDPRLDVRLVPTTRQPMRVVIDSRLETPPDARLLEPRGEVLIVAAADDAVRRAALTARGAQIVLAAGAGGKVALPAMLAELARRGVNELHVEAGARLNGSLLREDLVDELLIYLAPMMLGLGREMAHFGPLESLVDGRGFAFTDLQRIGADVRLIARRSRALAF